MPAELSRLQSRSAIQAALEEFVRIGRSAFLQRYGFGKSRDYVTTFHQLNFLVPITNSEQSKAVEQSQGPV